jgi:hypothetical protein
MICKRNKKGTANKLLPLYLLCRYVHFLTLRRYMLPVRVSGRKRAADKSLITKSFLDLYGCSSNIISEYDCFSN